jgi:hypothetical protein
MKTQSAWATISGKVYVSQDEIDDLLAAGEDEAGNKITTEQDAFKHLAEAKLFALFPTDDPFKHNETVIDMTSLRTS